MREYDEIAEWYVRTRDPTSGAADVEAFARRLPPEARVLDLGCGDGAPVTQILRQRPVEVVGLDSSAEMIARYRARFPDAEAHHARAQEARFEAEAFAGVVAWGVLFHLSAEDQRGVIASVGAWLASGGWFLFTSGGERGTREGTMSGVTFRYVSLGVDGYRGAVRSGGMRLVREHVNASGNHVYLAQKPS